MSEVKSLTDAQRLAKTLAQREWCARGTEAIAEFLRVTGAWAVATPAALLSADRYRVAYALMDHWFCGRTQSGLFIVSETWREGWHAGGWYHDIAKQLLRLSFRVAVLPSGFSTREAGIRQPAIIIPPNSDVDPYAIYQRLVNAHFKGAHSYEAPDRIGRASPVVTS